MIQILGLREYLDQRDDRVKKAEKFFDRGWRAPSVAELFANINNFLEPIPLEEQFNLYYTVSECHELPGRKLSRQTVIPFDVDGIDVEQAEDVARVAVEAIGADWASTGVVMSGNGVQFFIEQKTEITDDAFFDKYRPFYKACCAQINLALMDKGLQGSADVSVWSPARLMRLPGTENRKPNKPTRKAYLIQPVITLQQWDLVEKSGVIQVSPRDQLAISVMKNLPTPDTKAVQNECKFLQWAKEKQAEVREDQWYAMLSVVGRLEKGDALAHEYSNMDARYSEVETQNKLEQALNNSGPRTCKNINELWGKCNTCKHFNSPLVKSPIMIQGPDYVLTEKTGFHKTYTDTNGVQKVGKPEVEDLRRFFERKYRYVTMSDSKIVFIWTGNHWKSLEPVELEAFAYDHFKPKVTGTTRREFLDVIRCTNLRTMEWFQGSIERKINFSNGIFDIDTGLMSPHTPEAGFRYVLPYGYDDRAECPKFDQFMRDITCDSTGLEDVLMEYVGYAFSGDPCWDHHALMLVGVGRNGKSTFTRVLEALAGDGTYSNLTLRELKSEVSCYRLEGKLFNVSEESSSNALRDSSVFKNLVSGGSITVKKLYHQPYTVKNRAKLIFACNEFPQSDDRTDALYRRLIIVPFSNKFEGENLDSRMEDKLRTELPGIFNRVIAGYRRMIKTGGFSDSKEIRQQLEIYEEENDAVLGFFQDELDIVPFSLTAPYTAKKDIYQAYRFYADGVGEKPLGLPHFFRCLKRRLPDYEKRQVRPRDSGCRDRAVIGVTLARGGGM